MSFPAYYKTAKGFLLGQSTTPWIFRRGNGGCNSKISSCHQRLNHYLIHPTKQKRNCHIHTINLLPSYDNRELIRLGRLNFFSVRLLSRSISTRYLSSTSTSSASTSSSSDNDSITPSSSSSSSSSSDAMSATRTVAPIWIQSLDTNKPMDARRVYRYLQLEHYTEDELEDRYYKIVQQQQQQQNNEKVSVNNEYDIICMTKLKLEIYLSKIIQEMEEQSKEQRRVIPKDHDDTIAWKQEYIKIQTQQLWNFIEQHSPQYHYQHDDTNNNNNNNIEKKRQQSLKTIDHDIIIPKEQFISSIIKSAKSVDIARIWPLTLSMLMVGSTVGVTTPAMPFVVQNLGLTAGEYGMVVSAFALAKMTGNIPFAVLVERDGRKPYLVYSMIVISAGVGAIGLAGGFEQLYLCRLLTGLGVAGLSTAATMTVTDISTPLNRASTFAPIMSAFAAGTALGPALGGILVDQLGINPTFYLVGVSYIFLAGINNALLDETKARPMKFPWQQSSINIGNNPAGNEQTSIKEAFQNALGQWVPLLSEAPVRNVCIMNAFYWVALAGSQMTLLPLILTDPEGLAMTATQVGQVYMGMSAVQVLGNPILASLVDRVGKVPGIVGGCTLISAAMFSLPLCDPGHLEQMAGVLAMWAAGSSLLSTSPLAFISDRVDDEKRAQAIALLRTSGDVGFLIGASSMGALADWSGSLDMAMQSSSAILVTATAWFAARNILTAQLSKVSSKQ